MVFDRVSDILNNQKKPYTNEVLLSNLSRAVVPSERTMMSSNSTTAISVPSYMASKAGEFKFDSCTNININFNNYT